MPEKPRLRETNGQPRGLITRAHSRVDSIGSFDFPKEKTLTPPRIPPKIDWTPWFVCPAGPTKRPPEPDLPRTFVTEGEVAFLEFYREGEGDIVSQIRHMDLGAGFITLPLERGGSCCQVVIGNPDQRELIGVEINIGNRRQFCRFKIADPAKYAESLRRLKTGRDFRPLRDAFLVMASPASVFDPRLPFDTAPPRRRIDPEAELLQLGVPLPIVRDFQRRTARDIRNRGTVG